MVENQEMILKLLEKRVISLIKDIDIQREREHIKMKNLRKEIREFYHNYYSEKDKFIEDRFKKKIENLILIIENPLEIVLFVILRVSSSLLVWYLYLCLRNKEKCSVILSRHPLCTYSIYAQSYSLRCICCYRQQ